MSRLSTGTPRHSPSGSRDYVHTYMQPALVRMYNEIWNGVVMVLFVEVGKGGIRFSGWPEGVAGYRCDHL